jgi:hypothetical protein
MKLKHFLVAGLCSGLFGIGVQADERRFFNIYGARTESKGDVEYEQWFNWKTSTEEDRQFKEYDFRHELEIGVTDHFQIGLYLSDWQYENSRPIIDDKGHRDRVSRGDWNDVAAEMIYNFTDPVNDPIGLSVYGEVKGGEKLFELESKLILEKDFGAWAIAYNLALEAEWEEKHWVEDNGEIQQTAGISYQFSPKFLAGIELVHEIGIPDWKGAKGKAEFYLGPNFSYRAKSWWFTITPLFQVSDIEDEPDFQLQFVMGIDLK